MGGRDINGACATNMHARLSWIDAVFVDRNRNDASTRILECRDGSDVPGVFDPNTFAVLDQEPRNQVQRLLDS